MNFRFYVALYAGKAVSASCKILGRCGSNKPGEIACKICPDFIKHFKNIDLEKVIFITGTNGKSTTNNMVVHTLRSAGKTVTSNLEGANLMGGVATSLLNDASFSGKINSEYVVFETDERYLQYIYEYLPAKHICVTNIQIDQVQRNGEPDYIYQKIRSVIKKDTHLYVNAQEPRAASLARYSKNVTKYGMDANSRTYTKENFFDVTMPCPCCGNNIKFDFYNLDNIGKFQCQVCDFSSGEKADIQLSDVDFEEGTFSCEGRTYNVSNKESFFYYNYALCIALCRQFEISEDEIQKAFDSFKNISGRMESIKYGQKVIKYIRMKQENPETLQTALDYISSDKESKIFLFGLEEVKDIDPYYTNTFYSFAVGLERLEESNIERYICFSEAVSYDIANRLLYGGIDPTKITILPSNDKDAILAEIDKCSSDNVYLIAKLKTFEELDKKLKGKG